jgi:hypothetical protein
LVVLPQHHAALLARELPPQELHRRVRRTSPRRRDEKSPQVVAAVAALGLLDAELVRCCLAFPAGTGFAVFSSPVGFD